MHSPGKQAVPHMMEAKHLLSCGLAHPDRLSEVFEKPQQNGYLLQPLSNFTKHRRT